MAATSGNTVSVNVAAGTHTITKSGAINLFFLDFQTVESDEEETPTESDDATLSALSVSGYTLDPAFASATTVYSVELTAGTTELPTINATANDDKAAVSIDTESCTPAGQVVVKVTAENGDTKNYYINFTVAPYYYAVSASANTGGTASVSPSGSVAEGTSVTFTATANDGYVFSKWSDNSTENPHIVTVTGDLALTALFAAQGETSTLFSANIVTAPSSVVTVSASGNADMADYASVSGGTMTFYNANTKEYNVINANSTYMKFGSNKHYYEIDLNTALAEGDVISYSTTDEYEISFTTSANIATTPATTSHTYTVTSGDGLANATTIYIWRASGNTTIFSNLTITREGPSTPVASTDATLSDLQVNGTTVDGFNAETEVYNVSLPYGTTAVPVVSATKNDSGANVTITQASSASDTATVAVTAEDGITTKTYTVNFSVISGLALTDAANYVAGTYDAGDISYTRSTVSGNYGSFCLPFDFNISEASGLSKVYVPVNIAIYNTNTSKLRLFMKSVTGTVTAGTPFVALFNGVTSITSSAQATIIANMSNPAATDISVFDSDGSDGVLLENEDITLTWNGTYVTTAKVDGMMSFGSSGNFSEHKSSTLGAFRAYLVKETNFSNAIEIEFVFGDATAIDTVKAKSMGTMVNVYSVSGSMQKKNVPANEALSGLAPGMYIINGKVVVK